MLVREDDILTQCWWRVILLEANVEESVELDFDYLAQRDTFRDIEVELAEAMGTV